MRGQYAQGNQGGDNGIEVSQQKGPTFILLAIITSFFPSSISYMTSGIHGPHHLSVRTTLPKTNYPHPTTPCPISTQSLPNPSMWTNMKLVFHAKV